MKCLYFATALLISASAWAMDEMNQTLTATSGQNAIGVHLESAYAQFNIPYTNFGGTSGTVISKNTGLMNDMIAPDAADMTLSYFYGINDYISVGAGLGYTNLNGSASFAGYNSTSTTSGLTGLTVGYKGNAPLGPITLFTSALYEQTLGKSSTTDNANSTSSSSNAYPAQSSLNLAAGPVANLDSLLIGGLIRYQYMFSGSSNEVDGGVTTSSTVTNGNIFSLGPMIEWNNTFHPNIAVVYSRVYSTSYANNGQTTYSDGSVFYGANVSGRYVISPVVELNAKLAYYNLQANSTFSGGSWSELAVGTRILF